MAASVLFCTYFDSNFVIRGLAMIRSLARHRKAPWRMVVLCLDEAVEIILTQMREYEPSLASVELLSLTRLEAEDPALPAVKASRSRVEYFFTCTPVLCRWALISQPEETLVYLDADLWFFADDTALFSEMGSAPVAIIEHRFAKEHERYIAIFGRFNVGWVGFRRSTQALTCLERWRAQCLDWCGDSAEGGQFGDQKYLDDWPEQVPGLTVIENPGADLAPWNQRRHEVGRGPDGAMQVDDQPLVFYHFHGLGKWGGPGDYMTNIELWGAVPATVVRHLYMPYLAELIGVENSVAAHTQNLIPTQPGRLVRQERPHGLLRRLRRSAFYGLCNLRGRRVRFRAGQPDLLWRMLNWGKSIG